MDSKNRISRRKFVSAGAAAVTVATAASIVPEAIAFADTKRRHVKLIHNNDAAFVETLAKMYPGLMDDSRFKSILPMSILLVHASGPAVRAYTIVWSMTDDKGSVELPQYKIARARSHGSKEDQSGKHRKVKTSIAGQRDVIHKNSMVLVTPYFTLSPKTYKKSPTSWHSLVTSREPATFITNGLQAGSTLTAKLDAVIYRNKKIDGPDTYKLRGRFVARRNGERAQAREIHELIKNNRNSEIEGLLLKRATNLRRIGQTYNDWYFEARRSYAQQLLKSSSLLSTRQFSRLIESASSRKLTKLRRSKLPV